MYLGYISLMLIFPAKMRKQIDMILDIDQFHHWNPLRWWTSVGDIKYYKYKAIFCVYIYRIWWFTQFEVSIVLISFIS